MDEGQLVAAAKRGDLDAFNQLVVHYEKLAYHVAYRILGDGDASADAVQDALLNAYQALDQCRAASFKSWLMRIVTNACYDQLRIEQRRPAASLEALSLRGIVRELQPPHQAETPQAQVERQELSQLLQRGLRTLPANQRTAVILRDVAEMSYQEIADATTTSLGTVKSRISRARAWLRDYLLARRELLPARYYSEAQLAQ